MKRLAYLLLTLMLFAACTRTSREPRLVADSGWGNNWLEAH